MGPLPLRVLCSSALVLAVPLLAGACGLEQLTQGSKADAGTAAVADAGAGEAGVTGAACGVHGDTGVGLCRATSKCPTVAVDSDTHPNCGFRITGSSVDLVCACGTAICPMGTFATCPQAASLLATQSEVVVCQQINEGRCLETRQTGAGSSGSSGSSCDKACIAQCGGGAGCASVCGC